MKKKRYYLICAWLLLVCFAAGQYMIYAHQHNYSRVSGKSLAAEKYPPSQQTIKERCDLCDVMHHNAMLVSTQIHLEAVCISQRVYQSSGYAFKSIQLLLDAGRAPPLG